jgi:hypothetical protein
MPRTHKCFGIKIYKLFDYFGYTHNNTGITANNICKEWPGVVFLDK